MDNSNEIQNNHENRWCPWLERLANRIKTFAGLPVALADESGDSIELEPIKTPEQSLEDRAVASLNHESLHQQTLLSTLEEATNEGWYDLSEPVLSELDGAPFGASDDITNLVSECRRNPVLEIMLRGADSLIEAGEYLAIREVEYLYKDDHGWLKRCLRKPADHIENIDSLTIRSNSGKTLFRSTEAIANCIGASQEVERDEEIEGALKHLLTRLSSLKEQMDKAGLPDDHIVCDDFVDAAKNLVEYSINQCSKKNYSELLHLYQHSRFLKECLSNSFAAELQKQAEQQSVSPSN